ncbi:TPA: glycosyltransferase [Vibrio parahaemolyticus]|nr:glycosyltransferase [Vibrio parahaemolyticus]
MSNNNKRPLVSFIVVAYNQEKYIEEAIRGAFEQTYEPLEIILSDDNSPDKTFEIMQRLAEEYDGPHKVILNRNEPNLGIGGHISKVMELASADLVVVNAGDDVSVPERTSIIADEWLRSDRKIKCFGSGFQRIDETGKDLGIKFGSAVPAAKTLKEFIKDNPVFAGCTGAYDIDLYRGFGPFIEGLVNEDRILPFRCKILGSEFKYIDEPLIKYRVGGISGGRVNPFKDPFGRFYIKILERHIIDYQQKKVDLKLKIFNDEELNSLLSECDYQINLIELKLIATKNPFSFIKLFKRAGKNKSLQIHSIKLMIRNIFPYINSIRLQMRSVLK